MSSYLDFIKSADIQKGDTVYLISDITKLGIEALSKGERLVMDEVIDVLKEMIGPEGNLLFPTFTWAFCKGEGFDMNTTKSKCGSLTETARKRSDFKRTKHPIYSFAVWGKDAEYLCSLENENSWGKGTIFEWLGEVGAKCAMLGLPTLYGFTGTHHMEQTVGVPYRYNKNFTGAYTDENGITTEKTFSMYVRDLDINATAIKERPIGKILEQVGAAKVIYYGKVPFSIFRIKDAYEIERMDLSYNKAANMYTFPNGDPYKE